MKKMIIKKIFESKRSISGSLSTLANIRDAIYFQNKERIDELIDIFDYNFDEIEYTDIFSDDDRIYVIQTKSNKFLEVEKEDLERFDI